ncbi:hypothetical protein FRB93_011820 [Tulasnella sp. JGI-2019a]|nr:hypothetical protein FRB93_011820 [Tulasnella sp. JGI-2019a]
MQLCVQCPSSNDRVIETGDEDFLGEDFGLPVILVFTKYDLLLDAKECEVREEHNGHDYDDTKITTHGSQRADEEYKRSCIKPLDRIRGAKLHHARVSFHNKDSIDKLVELTGQLARDRIIWNFLDPELFLEREEVKVKLWEVVDDLAPKETTSPNAGIRASAAAGGGVAAIFGGAFPPAAPIVVPITVGATVLVKWLYDVYRQTPGIIQILMAYIVDLTAILEGVLHLIQPRSQDAAEARAQQLSQDLIFLAVEAYNKSDAKKQAHIHIKAFVGTVQNIFNRERVLGRVVSLLETQRFDPGEEYKRRARRLR